MHPQFGRLTHERGIWSGEAHRDGRDIRFSVAGDETKPDAGFLASMCDILPKFREVERLTLEYICGLEPSVRPEDFSFSELCLPWVDKRTDFVLTFALEGDAYGSGGSSSGTESLSRRVATTNATCCQRTVKIQCPAEEPVSPAWKADESHFGALEATATAF